MVENMTPMHILNTLLQVALMSLKNKFYASPVEILGKKVLKKPYLWPIKDQFGFEKDVKNIAPGVPYSPYIQKWSKSA